MTMKKIYKFCDLYGVVDDEVRIQSLVFGNVASSNKIVGIYDLQTKQYYYSLWNGGGNHMNDYLPGGVFYLGDTIETAIENLKEKNR